MGLKTDVGLLAAGIAAVIIFREQIGGALSQTGGILGGGLAGGLESFFKSLTGIVPSAQESIRTPDVVVSPDPTAQGALTVEQATGATSILQTETGVFVDGQQVATITPEPSLIDTISGFFSGLIPSIPTATAEIQPEIQTVIEPLPIERPLSLAQISPVPVPTVISELPDSQIFGGEGISFIGGTVRENPIDTLSEVLTAFPQLTASQAADFLSEHSGILPSQLSLVDPDIKNIVASIEGQQVQVPTIGISDLQQQEIIAAKTTCSLFGLNCELAGMG